MLRAEWLSCPATASRYLGVLPAPTLDKKRPAVCTTGRGVFGYKKKDYSLSKPLTKASMTSMLIPMEEKPPSW